MCIAFRHDLISRAGFATDKRIPSALLTVSNRKMIMKIIAYFLLFLPSSRSEMKLLT
jgi:hypothetical protein